MFSNERLTQLLQLVFPLPPELGIAAVQVVWLAVYGMGGCLGGWVLHEIVMLPPYQGSCWPKIIVTLRRSWQGYWQLSYKSLFSRYQW